MKPTMDLGRYGIGIFVTMMGNNTPFVFYILGLVKNVVILSILILFLLTTYGELCVF